MSSRRQGPTLLNRSLAEGIQEIGFRSWYQRELLAGHAQLVLLVLSVLGFMACLELMSSLPSGQRLLNAAAAVVCVAAGAWALRRYLYLLLRAESIANQARCADCGTYGRLTLVAEDSLKKRVSVCCRKCSARWQIQE